MVCFLHLNLFTVCENANGAKTFVSNSRENQLVSQDLTFFVSFEIFWRAFEQSAWLWLPVILDGALQTSKVECFWKLHASQPFLYKINTSSKCNQSYLRLLTFPRWPMLFFFKMSPLTKKNNSCPSRLTQISPVPPFSSALTSRSWTKKADCVSHHAPSADPERCIIIRRAVWILPWRDGVTHGVRNCDNHSATSRKGLFLKLFSNF